MKNSQPSESWVGRSFEVDIEKVAHGGIFVARHEGRVVFVSHVLPGERVKVRVYEDRSKGFCRAEPIKIITASPDRVDHVWPEAAYDSEKNLAGAGGAEFGHIKLERQRELKADVIKEALQRMAGIELRPTVEAAPGDDAANGLGYRTRIQLHVNEYGDVGPYRERTHEVVKVASLPLANEDIQELEMQNRNYQGVSKIEVAASSTGQAVIKVDSKLSSSERPASLCNTLGVADFMRVPLPAAMITMLSAMPALRLRYLNEAAIMGRPADQIACSLGGL